MGEKNPKNITESKKRKKNDGEIENYSKKVEILNNVIALGNKADDLKSFLKDVIQSIVKLLDFEGGGVYLVDEAKELAELVCHYGLSSGFLEDAKRVKIDQKPYDTIFIKGKPIFTDNYQNVNSRVTKKHGFVSICSIPLFEKGAIIGALNIASKKRYCFSDFEKNTLQFIGQEVGTVIEKIKSRKLLEESEEKYRLLFENNVVGVGISDTEGNIIELNDAMCKITGYAYREQLNVKIPDTYINPKDRIEIFSILKNVGFVKNFEVQLRNKQGNPYWVNMSVKPIEYEGKNVFMTTCSDISTRKQAEEVIKRNHIGLEKLIEERTREVEETHAKIEATKDHLQGIIDSTSDIIISVDKDNIIDTWNKQAEYITGFKQKNVVGKHISELEVFDNPQELLENIQIVYGEKVPESDKLVLKTKNGVKKTIKRFYSSIKDGDGQPVGILCVGKDITGEMEIHRRLLWGNSYLISDDENDSPLDLFINLASDSCKGLCITRANPEIIKSSIPPRNITTMMLKQTTTQGFDNIQDLRRLIKEIKEFTENNTKSVVFLDRVDYLLSNYSFEQFIKSLYQITDVISENNSMMLLCLDPSVIDEQQFAIIRKELQYLPSQKLEDIHIKGSCYDILKLVYRYNQNNMLISFKKISQELLVNNKTISKRMKDLEGKQLISIKKHGNQKTAYVSEKGKALLHRRSIY